MNNIDNFDLNILKEIQRDANLAIETVAEKVSLSRNACWRRIKRLENDGIIQKKVMLLSAEHIGLNLSAFVIIKAKEHTPEWLQSFQKAIAEMPEIVGAFRMSGDLDYLLRVQLSDMPSYDKFYQDLISRIMITDISASFVMEKIKDTTELPL